MVVLLSEDFLHRPYCPHNLYKYCERKKSPILCFCCCRDALEGSCPKTKPPPLLSLHRPPTSSLGGPNMRGPHISHSGPSSSRGGPLLHTAPPFLPGPRGPHGIRGAPPSLKSARLPLLASPGRFLLHPPFALA